MSTHNICFYGKLTKMIFKLSPNTLLICFTVTGQWTSHSMPTWEKPHKARSLASLADPYVHLNFYSTELPNLEIENSPSHQPFSPLDLLCASVNHYTYFGGVHPNSLSREYFLSSFVLNTDSHPVDYITKVWVCFVHPPPGTCCHGLVRTFTLVLTVI